MLKSGLSLEEGPAGHQDEEEWAERALMHVFLFKMCTLSRAKQSQLFSYILVVVQT